MAAASETTQGSPPHAQARAGGVNDVLDQISSRKLIIVSGKGGVGRTTLAAMLGLAAARRGRRVLVATTGHDDRLAWMMGASYLTNEPRTTTQNLSIQRLVPQTCIREYGSLVLRSQKVSQAVFDNRIVRPLLRAIPGLDDFALVGKAWHEAIRGDDFDTVVFDGPATGHLLFALGVPRAILESVPSGPLTQEAELMQASFEDPERVQSILVGLPESWPLTELSDLGFELRKRVRIGVAGVVVNGVWPSDVPSLAGVIGPTKGRARGMLELVERVGTIGRAHEREVEAWSQSEAAERCGAPSVLLSPWCWGGIGSLRRLESQLEALSLQPEGSA